MTARHDMAAEFDLLDEFVQVRLDATRTPAASVAFFDRERIVRVATFGFADPEAERPVTPDTLFEIGSITKSFTAVAVMRAVDQGLLDLHRPAADYLPWLEVQSEFEPFTLHHLLTHTAGLVGVIDRSPDMRGAVWALRETETAWPPGSRFAYSDAGYQVLALILEAVTGQSFAEIIRSNIFAPLGMSASEPVLTHAIRPRLARGYRPLYDDRPEHANHPLVPAVWIEVSAGDCSIASTAGDMARFGQMLLNRGRTPDGRFLSTDSFDLLVGPHASAGWCEYGYGIMTQENDGHTTIGHGGGMPGYTAEIALDAQNGIGLVLMTTDPRSPGLFWKLMGAWRAICRDVPLDTVDLTLPDPYAVNRGDDFVGEYRCDEKSFRITAEGERLFLHWQNEKIGLESRGSDRFYVDHADFDRHLLEFGRIESEGATSSSVVEAMHGPDWYTTDAYVGPRKFDHPSDWDAYPGHYRAHIPWLTNFRVLLRKGQLWLAWPDGNEDLLFEKQPGEFFVGEEKTPERIRFDQIADGQALRATLSACDYYRFFTP